MSSLPGALVIVARAPDLHPFMVAARLAKEGAGEDAFICGLLHDSLEDNYATERELWDLLPERIYNTVRTVTRRLDETYWEYILRIQESGDPLAILVKRADAEENLDRCLADGDPQRARRYATVLERLNA